MSSSNHHRLLNRIPELDGLRGVAILAVLIYHFFWFPSPGREWNGLFYYLWRIAQIGWIGVDIFFVLSGFLITRILLSQKEDPRYFSKFYFRRAVRILPVYLLTLIFIHFYYPGSGKFILLSLCFLANGAQMLQVRNVYPALWSLSVEEQFYFVWPWIVRKLQLENLFRICIFLCFCEPIVRGISFLTQGHFAWIKLFGTFDGFAVGGAIALCSNLIKLGRGFLIGALILSFSLLPFGIFTRTTLVGEMFLLTSLYLLMGAVIVFSIYWSGYPALNWLSKGFLPHWGKLSYSAYLCHYPVHEWVEWALGQKHLNSQILHSGSYCLGRAGLSIVGTYILSNALYFAVEEPFLRLKGKMLVKNTLRNLST